MWLTSFHECYFSDSFGRILHINLFCRWSLEFVMEKTSMFLVIAWNHYETFKVALFLDGFRHLSCTWMLELWNTLARYVTDFILLLVHLTQICSYLFQSLRDIGIMISTYLLLIAPKCRKQMLGTCFEWWGSSMTKWRLSFSGFVILSLNSIQQGTRPSFTPNKHVASVPEMRACGAYGSTLCSISQYLSRFLNQ